MKLSPSEICTTNRFRKDVDDGIKELCDSIADVGQLQPILINPDYQLIVGERRLRACELLGIDVECVITTTLDDGAKRIRAERDENHCRKPWTPSEWVAIGKALEAIEKPKAAERKASGVNQHSEPASKLDEASKGRSDAKVAEALGKSKDTYRKAREVVEAAADETLPEPVRETAKAAVKQMDETGKVDGAYKAVKAAKENPDAIASMRATPNVSALANTASPEEIKAEAEEPVELFRLKQLWRKSPKRIQRMFRAWLSKESE